MCRRLLSALVTLALVSATAACFVVADRRRGSVPAADYGAVCAGTVCDDRLHAQVTNSSHGQTAALASYGVVCAAATAAAHAPPVWFRSGLPDASGTATCVRAYDFCHGLADEVARDLESDICADAYFKVQRHSSLMWEYIPWCALVVVNVLLRWIVRRMGECEQHTSKAKRALSMAKKLFLAQLANTALSIWAVHIVSDAARQRRGGPAADQLSETFDARWYRETGVGVCLAMLLNGIIPKAGVILRAAWRRCCRLRCCNCCCCGAVTQEQLNEQFAGQELDLPARYACVWNTVFSSLLYSAGMPVLVLIAAIDLGLLHVTEKYFLYHFYSKPTQYDEQLAITSSKILPFAVLCHLAMATWMYASLGTFGEHVITEAAYAKTRARGLNVTVVEDGPTGLIDEISDVLLRRHVTPVVLLLVGLIAAMLACTVVSPARLLRPCRRFKFCRFRVVPERVYRTYTESVGEIRLG
jgi:hypothetical protein